MRKIFILGGGSLQLDLILEAKKMFFYTIVLDMDKDCVGLKWCDEFLHIDISNKELILEEAKNYEIDSIVTSATELGNVTACYVGEKLGLNTNSYQTALNTTNKSFMKKIFVENNIQAAKYKIFQNKDSLTNWNLFPCIVKPIDSSAGRGVSYCKSKNEAILAINKAYKYSNSKDILIEEYINGEQYSCETISSLGNHQLIVINQEFIKQPPHVMELSHTMPAIIDDVIEKKIRKVVYKILDIFNIQFGAAHIELKVDSDGQIYIIELASRIGGMRIEMINLAFGISYSQLLILSSLNMLSQIIYPLKYKTVQCKFLVDYETYQEYLDFKKNQDYVIFEPFPIPIIEKNFVAEHIGLSMGYYWVLSKK